MRNSIRMAAQACAAVSSLSMILALATPAAAQSAVGDSAWPKVGTETQVDFEYDHLSPKHDRDGGALNIQAGQQTLIELDNRWSVSNLLTLQPMQSLQPGDHRVLADHGLFAEELFARWNNQRVNIKVGKFAQNFARAWYLTPGLYGQDIVGDYALGETLGAEAQVMLGDETFGLHQVSASAFMADRTILSESLFYNRGRLTRDAGGSANTSGLKSFVVSYDATNVPVGHAALDYQISLASLGHGVDGDKDERRGSAGFNFNIPLNGSVEETLRGRFSELRLLAEAVRIDSADGISGQRRDYLIGAVEYQRGQWVFDLTASDRRSMDPFAPAVHDKLQSVAIGYSLPSDMVVAVGLAHEVIGGQDGILVGLQVSQTLTTCDRCLIRGRHY